MAQNSPFYDSKREEYERKHKPFKPLLSDIKKSKPILSKAKYKDKKLFKPIIDKKSDKFKNSKWTQPLLKSFKEKQKEKGTQSKWTQPLLKQSYKHEKYSEEKKKQIQRLRRFIKSAESRGYEFDDNIIDLALSADELKKITPKELYKKASFYDELSGEIFSGEEGRKIENYRRTKKAQETRENNKTELEINTEDNEEVFADESEDYLDDDLVNSEYKDYENEYEREQRKAEYNPNTDIQDNNQFKNTNETDEYYSDEFDIIEASIEAIPDTFWCDGEGHDLIQPRQMLLNSWYNLLHRYSEKKSLYEVHNYITDKDVMERFHQLEYRLGESNFEAVMSAIQELATIFNLGRPLDAETSAKLESLNDYFDNGY